MLKALLLQRIFFNPDRYAPDCVPRVLSGTSWFLRLWCCSRWFQIYTF